MAYLSMCLMAKSHYFLPIYVLNGQIKLCPAYLCVLWPNHIMSCLTMYSMAKSHYCVPLYVFNGQITLCPPCPCVQWPNHTMSCRCVQCKLVQVSICLIFLFHNRYNSSSQAFISRAVIIPLLRYCHGPLLH
jgi:hypothetical protein